jgi:hypothetical protein
MPWLATQDVSAQPHAMDLLLEVPSLEDTRETLRIGIDCKNRRTSVTHSELQRFEVDSRQYDGGVLVLRHKCTLQKGWSKLGDDLIQVTRRLFIITNFESNVQWLHYVISKISVECAVVVNQPEEEIASLNGVLEALQPQLKESIGLAKSVVALASDFQGRMSSIHVPRITESLSMAQHQHPGLMTVPITNVFQSEPGLRGAIKKRKATAVF